MDTALVFHCNFFFSSPFPISTNTCYKIRLSFASAGRRLTTESSSLVRNRRHQRIVRLNKIRLTTLFRCHCNWPKCFNIFWSFAFGIVGIFFLYADLAAEAIDNTRALSLRYACEDVPHYYAHVDQMEGAALLKELNSIVSGHQSLSYKEVWDALKILDAADVDNPEASSDVVEIYSLRAVSKKLAGKPEGMEQQNFLAVNSSRGNKYYGECSSHSTDCLKPANREAASDTETDRKRWAPPLQVRGDIARSLMYMAVRYGFYQPGGGPHLQLSNSPSIEKGEMGLLSALLKWNELDPPSRAEKLRNDRICKLYQHNRNPFIDHPEYANLIWKNAILRTPVAYGFSPKAWINEFHYNNKGKDQNEFVEIIVGPSSDAADLVLALYNGANKKMYMSLPLADKRAFKVTDGGSGFLIYTTFIPLQNGPADGMALVSTADGNDQKVIQFLSYDGIVKAADGPAEGTESIDIKLRETEGSSEHDSLGLTGMQIGKFKWKKFIDGASPGKPNIGQCLSDS
ncbi:extracellular ribonuclease-like protein [Cinnamomum micranthum f. kanehirae]|uniref:Extracellular ribonuclease-like protein n=1 Tax=Cinnamomum micranthum f. kanehirae TaxID=337451 RepID=A0A3S3QXW7_9MAGN|nr:extracellular ribonuclease-like protein [Cinnamomum micranthum f. kanehirae]